ncbi:tafazzin-like [Palaemon carinicauda]|uniref:tafazzin-like n=1 Tax=Palaemon carinicauda TaxID=392227 RepID=UPI0035B588B2
MECVPPKQEDIPLCIDETSSTTTNSGLSSYQQEEEMQEVKIHPKDASVGSEKQFSLKHGWPFPDMTNPPLSFRIRSAIVIPLVGTFSKILMNCCNTVHSHNLQQLIDLVANRPAGVPLVTVSNHYSCLDDPGLWGILRLRELWNAKKLRWSPAAHDIAFTKRFYNWFFSAGRCVPIIRGIGVYQDFVTFTSITYKLSTTGQFWSHRCFIYTVPASVTVTE